MFQDSITCPHCRANIDMTDCERYSQHTTYWGEEEAQPIECPECDVKFFLKERVIRHWHVGRTLKEAGDNYA